MTIINDHNTRRDFVRRSQKRRLVYVICTWVRVTVKDYKLFVPFFSKARPSAGSRPTQQQPSQASPPLSTP